LLQRLTGAPTDNSSAYNNTEIAVIQEALQGDFVVTATWEDFQPGDAVPFVGPGVDVGVWWNDSTTGSVYQATASVGTATAMAVVIGDGEFTRNALDPSPAPESLIGASGTFRIQRQGTLATVTTTVNGATVSAQSTELFTTEPLTLFMGIGASDGWVSAVEASIRILDVVVEGGGSEVLSDDFSCEG
jgi:hypothetical protein